MTSVTSAHALERGNSTNSMNFRFSPLGLLIGAINISMDFPIDPNWTVGPTLSYWHFKLSSDAGFKSDYDITAFGGGARANWFKNGNFTDGLYVGPSVQYTNVKLTTTDAGGDVSGTASGLFAGCL